MSNCKEIILFKGKIFSRNERLKVMELYKEFRFKYEDDDRVDVTLTETPLLDDVGRRILLEGAQDDLDKILNGLLSNNKNYSSNDLEYCVQTHTIVSIKIKNV